MSGIRWVGEAAHGEEALELIRTCRPDVVFLDIELPGLSGLEVSRRMEPGPRVIFTTAYDEHAVTAFELRALDYVLKPFTRRRLEEAVSRALEAAGPESAHPELSAAGPPDDAPVDRVYVRARGRIVPVRMDDVEHLEADGDYVRLWEGSRCHLVRLTLSRLLTRADPRSYVRIHRSHAVNLDRVRSFRPLTDGRVEVELESGKRVTASRGRTPDLRKRIGSP